MLTLVIMLNVLIAIISEEFEKVMARREEESLLKQASTIVDLEAVYLSFATYNGTARGEEVSLVDYSRVLRFYWQHVKKVPAHVVSQLNVGAEYLHTLVPQLKSDDDAAWKGRLKAITRQIERSELRVFNELDEIKKRLE